MITTTSEYALRMLVKLAQAPPGELVGGRELSEDLGIPSNYLSKVMLVLRNGGIVETSRGLGGGYRLQKAAGKIRLVDVIELFEGVSTRPHCFLGEKSVCSDADPCSAHAHFRMVRMAYIRYLETTTIGAIATGPSPRTKRKPKKKVRR